MTVDFKATLQPGSLSRPVYTADPSEEAEMSDSDDDDLPSVRKIIARSKSTIDLTLDDDDDSTGENAIEVSKVRITRTAQHSVTLIPQTPTAFRHVSS